VLIVTRGLGESVMVGTDILVTVVGRGTGNKVRLGIQAPSNLVILRSELFDPDKEPEVLKRALAMPDLVAEWWVADAPWSVRTVKRR
jgi:carbon storage regulator